ncbi:MAG: malate dehydrogenase [Candidatus Omnitrophica bacterium]|nr:malate dehydrogenase [Candidatus Omnitrophota bacterium]
MKVSIIGAGAVGATVAMRVVESGLADVVLLDVLNNVACGKSLDILDAAPIIGHEKSIIGTDDYNQIKSSDIVVITAGLARKPGMTREELIAKNAGIVREVSGNIKIHAPSSIVIVVTNPLDSMTYLTYKTTGFKRQKVFGMAGVLDGSRFVQLISEEMKVKRSSVETYILGSHGDSMVPLLSHTRVSGKPIEKVLSKDRLEAIIKRTCDRGMEIVSLLGTGSACYSPSAAVYRMIDAILNDTKNVHVVSTCLNGEYGLKGISIGVPCVIGRNGIEDIVELKLSKDEVNALSKSAEAIKRSIELL